MNSGETRRAGQEEEQEAPLQHAARSDIETVPALAEPEFAYASAPAHSAVSFLQWSPEAARRKAFVKIGGGSFTLVHEGDAVDGYTVIEIQQDAVALQSGTTRFRLHVR